MRESNCTPVLVGIGTASRREDNFANALEAMDLMIEAVSNAGKDSGSSATLPGAQYIAVPRGRWSYPNPAGEIAERFGIENATTVLASVRVLQQTLVGEACARTSRGEIHTALVAGGDAGYRLLRAKIAGQWANERKQDSAPDINMAPKEELGHPVEIRAGLVMPVGLYAIMESAFRAKHGWSVDQHRDRIAAPSQRLWEKLVTALGLEHLLADPRFESVKARTENLADLQTALHTALGRETVEYWIAHLAKAGIPAAQVAGLDQSVTGTIAEERATFMESDSVPLVRLPWKIDEQLLAWSRPAPRLGEHTEEVLRELGYTESEIEGLLRSGGAAAVANGKT